MSRTRQKPLDFSIFLFDSNKNYLEIKLSSCTLILKVINTTAKQCIAISPLHFYEIIIRSYCKSVDYNVTAIYTPLFTAK